ncbi:MAG: hypothetical protein MUO72_05810 [Bacteroidales bacterium]|nr:hypothetical protein [Bacteroidales bacterium]
MKRADKSAMATRNLNELISKLSEDGILDLQTMIHIRGGDGEGGGGEPVIIIPPKNT